MCQTVRVPCCVMVVGQSLPEERYIPKQHWALFAPVNLNALLLTISGEYSGSDVCMLLSSQWLIKVIFKMSF